MSDRVVDEIQTENHFTRTEVEKLIHYVKEDMPSADLSQMPYKYADSVLIACCMRNASFITKEPFTHESLLIDKKEYKLSEREKQLAHREYQNDKRNFPYAARQSYINSPHLLNSKYPVSLGLVGRSSFPNLSSHLSQPNYSMNNYVDKSSNVYNRIVAENDNGMGINFINLI